MPTPVDISASRGSGVLDISRYGSPVETWLLIMENKYPGFCAENNYTFPPPPDNPAIAWGIAFEDAIVALAERSARDKIINREQLIQHDYLSCHIDGQYENSECLHEGKTTSQYNFANNFGEPGTDMVPSEYQIQVQHQMMLTGIEKCILSVLVFPKRQDEFVALPSEVDCLKWAETLAEMGYFHQYIIFANKKLQALMFERYVEYWEKYIIGKTEPQETLYSDFALLVPNPQGTIVATEQVERWASEYKLINAEKSDLDKRKEQLKILVLRYMKEQDQDVEKILDDDSRSKWVLRDRTGRKLFQYDGKSLR